MAHPTEVFEFYGSSVRSQLARRAGEAVWFTRRQTRHPRYGYQWSAWEVTAQRPYWASNGDCPVSYSETGSGWQRSSQSPAVRLPRTAN